MRVDCSILFNATAEKQLPPEICETSVGREDCRLPLDVTGVVLPISSLTWTSSLHPMDRGPTLPWL